MFTLLTHCLYGVIFMYGYKGMETYQAQRSTGLVTKKDAFRNALLWPKYLLK